METQDEAVPSKKHMPFGGARAINNPVIEEYINFAMMSNMMEHIRAPYVVDHFLHRYHAWLQSSGYNTFKGLDTFKHLSYSNGTTETFDKWYIRHHGRRLRIFRGEYMYHYATYRNLGMPYAWLEDAPLDVNDHVIISMPFADSGNIHHETQSVLDSAAVMGVPVLIDSAWLGITHGLDFDFSHPAIDTVAVSLSKTFPVAHARIGMRLCRKDIDDGMDIYRKTRYENRWGAALGNMLLASYGIDYNVICYAHWQKFKCDEMNLIPSNTVLFGLGGTEWGDYNRGGFYNRLFLGELYEQQL